MLESRSLGRSLGRATWVTLIGSRYLGYVDWVALPRSRGLGLRQGDSDPSKTTSDLVTFSDDVVFGRKISERCFFLRFHAFFFFFFWFYLDSCFFISLSGLINQVLKTRFLGGHHVKKMPHQT